MIITTSAMVRFWNFVVKHENPDQCWLWNGSKDQRGYGRMHVDRKGHPRKAHRISWQLHNGRPPPDGVEVCHRCDNPECTNPTHLFVGSHAENMADAKMKGRPMGPRPGVISVNVGERNPQAKLTADAIDVIMQRLAAGDLQRSIAKDFGVKQQSISKIANGKLWRHLRRAASALE